MRGSVWIPLGYLCGLGRTGAGESKRRRRGVRIDAGSGRSGGGGQPEPRLRDVARRSLGQV